jgi:hypothetical protein
MRNFSKTLISMAAVMAVGSAMAAGAMAADLTIGKDTVKTDGKISISDVTPGKSQYTLLVVQGTKAEGDTEVTYNATEATIKQIDQNDAGVAFTEAVVGTDLADGDYKVMVGNNDGTVDTGYFTLSSAPVVEYRDYTIGDINDDKRILTNDGTFLKKKIAKKTEGIGLAGQTLKRETGKDLIIGDINDDGRILTNDGTFLKKKIAKKTEGISLAGTIVKVVK